MPKTAVIPTEFPGNIQLEPNEIHFIRPCRTVQKKILRLTNTSEKKIGWAIWTSSEKRMKVEPPAAPNLKFPGKIPDLNRTRQPYGTLLPGKTVSSKLVIEMMD